IYVMLNAEFVAVIQVLVYAGAIMVLFLFVLMLLSDKDTQSSVLWTPGKAVAVGATVLVFIQIISSFLSPAMRLGVSGEYTPEAIAEIGSIAIIGRLLFTDYVLAFEVVSILLLVAVIGAVVIAKRRFE
ncbi:MAG: NADH-quinone oxidoreductase subunit J, partial [Pelagibacteraceae bacterium]